MPVLQMSVTEWIDVPDNPRQRDTLKRASFAVRRHLSKYRPVHRYVFAAYRDGTVLCKLDGHTRAYLWSEGMLECPPDGTVDVMLVPVKTMKDAKIAYGQLDAPLALKKPCDIVFGAVRENKFKLHSPLLRTCRFTTQLKLADSGKRFAGDVHQLVAKWKTELVDLDKLNLSSNYTILISVMLMAIRRDGVDVAGKFFTTLDKGEGTKTKGGSDGPDALHRHIETRRAAGSTAGYDNLILIQRHAWFAYERWIEGKLISAKTLGLADVQSTIDELQKVIK